MNITRGPVPRVLSFAAVVVLLAVPSVRADDGQLDAGFGVGGRVITDLGGMEAAGDVAVQPDGKILVAGVTVAADLFYRPVVVRYLPGGTPDGSFGEGGVAYSDSYPQTTFLDKITSMVVVPGGAIVVAGNAPATTGGFDWVLYRFTQDGRPDSSFGGGGQVVVDSGYFDSAIDLVAQPDGKLVVLGTRDGHPSVMRFDTAGRVDGTFGSGGTVTLTEDDDALGVGAIAMQPDGKIVAAGFGAVNAPAVYRLTPAGKPDKTFGQRGTVSVRPELCPDPNSGVVPFLQSVVIAPDGAILLGGLAPACDVLSYSFVLVRLDASGRLDESWGDGGVRVLGLETQFTSAPDVVAQRDGKILFAGKTGGAGFRVARLSGDGTLDPTFGEGGIAGADFASPVDPTVRAAFGNGGVVVAFAPSFDFLVSRYENQIAPPEITAARVVGKKLVVEGRYFDRAATILVNGVAQPTKVSGSSAALVLSSKRAVKALPPNGAGAVQVRTHDGAESTEVPITR